MKRVLITGANGFVGNHLITELKQHNYDVVAIGGDLGNSKIPDGVSEYKVLNLLDIEDLKVLSFADVDYVIHLAGLATVGPSFDDPMKYIETNIGIEVNMFETALKQNYFPKFLVISSGTLYDVKNDLPLTEGSSTLSSSPYAVSKLGQEELARYYTKRGFDCVIARPFNHFGPGQNLGFIVRDLAQQIVDVEKGLADEIKVGNLDAQRDYTDVRDIVKAYRILLEKGVNGETYNICSGVPVSGMTILDSLISNSLKKPTVSVDEARLRPSDDPVIYGSHEKLTQITGWEPEIDLDTTIKDVLEDWRHRS